MRPILQSFDSTKLPDDLRQLLFNHVVVGTCAFFCGFPLSGICSKMNSGSRDFDEAFHEVMGGYHVTKLLKSNSLFLEYGRFTAESQLVEQAIHAANNVLEVFKAKHPTDTEKFLPRSTYQPVIDNQINSAAFTNFRLEQLLQIQACMLSFEPFDPRKHDETSDLVLRSRAFKQSLIDYDPRTYGTLPGHIMHLVRSLQVHYYHRGLAATGDFGYLDVSFFTLF